MDDNTKTSVEQPIDNDKTIMLAILGIIGEALLYAAEFNFICCFPLKNSSESGLFSAFCFGSMGLCYFLFRKGSAGVRKALLVWPQNSATTVFYVKIISYGILASICIATFGLFNVSKMIDLVFVGILGFVAGFCCGLLKLSWTGHVGRQASVDILRNSHAGVPLFLGITLALFLIWLDWPASYIVVVVCPIVSAILLFAAIRGSKFDLVVLESRDDASYLDNSNHLLLFGYLSIFGYCFGLYAEIMNRTVCTIALIIAAALVAYFVFSKRELFRKKEFRTDVGAMARFFLPTCVILSFLFLAALSDMKVLWCFAPIIALPAAVFQTCSNITFLENLSIKQSTDAVALVAAGRFPPLLGLGFGLFLSWGITVCNIDLLLQIVPCLLLVTVVASYSLLPFNHGNPVAGGIVYDIEEGVIPLFFSKNENVVQSFNRECADIVAEYNLSPREEEVFRLLARGYNSTIIAEKLFISNSTVKTHCFRIYQKLGVHSRQDIVDLLQQRL